MKNKNEDIDLGKLQPQAVDVEEVVLGAMLIDKEYIVRCLSILKPEHFYKQSHEIIYSAILDLYHKNDPIDLITVINSVKNKGKLDEIGGAYAISQLTDRVASSDNIEYHSTVILDKFIAREIIKVATKSVSESYKSEGNSIDIIDELSNKVSDLLIATQSKKHLKTTDIIHSIVKKVHENQDSKELSGVPTPFKNLNERTGGWQPSDLIIIAARPAMGKLQPLTEPVLTPKGWVNMGDIKKGTTVCCPVSGKGVEVKQVFPANNLSIYKIEFNDGSWTECCNEHLWKIQTQTDISKGKSRVVDIDWMLNNGVLDTRNKSKYRIQLTNPISFKSQKTALHPYLLGLFIADGYLPQKGQITITCHSKDVIARFNLVKKIIPSEVKIKLSKQYDSSNARKIIFSSNIKHYLKDLNLLGKKSRHKFIPDSYIYNSIETRKELLSALMDTDGSCFIAKGKNSKQASYSTMSEKLKNDVIEVVKSLGGKASASSEKRKKYKKGACWNISLKTPFNPFTKKSKKDIFSSKQYKETFTKTIRNIEFLRKDKGQCILVDSKDHLYITRDYTVTHNTSLALQLATFPVFFHQKRVLFYSLEMSSEQLVARVLGQELEIPANRFTRDAQYMDLDEMNQRLSEKDFVYDDDLIIVDEPGLDIKDMAARAKSLHMKSPLDMIIVDYLQLASSRGVKSREQEIGAISRGLKGLAKQLNIPVIALSQLSRAVESRGGDRRPQLSDLRESGSIEQDADMVMFPHRPEYYNITEDEEGNDMTGKASVITAKYRNGGVGEDLFNWNKNLARFENIETNTYMESFKQLDQNDDFDDNPF